MAYEVVISDLGGVVVDFNADRLVHQVSALLGRSFEEVQAVIYHDELLLPFELGQIEPQAYYEGLKTRLQLSWTYGQFVRAWNDIFTENYEVTQLLRRLHSRYRLIALSNTNTLHIAHIKSSISSLDLFDDWVTSCEVGLRKPDREIYLFALRRAGVMPQAAVYIDDRPELVEAGRRVGLTAIRCESSAQLERDLRRLGLTL